MTTMRYADEVEFSSGTSASSGNTLEAIESQPGNTAYTFSIPTPEFLKLQLSPAQVSGVGLELSHQQSDGFGSDWMGISGMMDLGDFRPSLDTPLSVPEQSSFTPPGLPIHGQSASSNDATQPNSRTDSPQSFQMKSALCQCGNNSLEVIPELQQYSTGRLKLSVDNALRLARRGASTISNHLDCPHHSATNSSSQTCLLACILILFQVAASYRFLQNSLNDSESQNSLPISLGDLRIEDYDTQKHVVNAVLAAEIRSIVALSMRLEEWSGNLQSSLSALPCGPLLAALKQELENASGSRTKNS